MLYNPNLEKTGRIEFVFNDNSKISMYAILLDECYDILLCIPKETVNIDSIVTPNGIEEYIENNTMQLCAHISINESNIGILTIAKPNVSVFAKKLLDGKQMLYSARKINNEDEPLPIIFDFNDIKEINADSRLWIQLLNTNFIETTDKSLRKYNALPETRIYGLDEFGKPKVKKYIK